MIVRAPTQAELDRLAPPGVKLRPMPVVNCVNKFPAGDRIANILASYNRNLPNLIELEGEETGREAVIISGGPSADACLDKIREYNDYSDYCVLTIERMLPWCLANRIQPEYVVTLDAAEDVVEGLQTPPCYSRYLVALQCRPEVLDCLKHNEVYVFQTVQKEVEDGPHKEVRGASLNAGGSVSLCAMSVSMLLGMRNLHVFGFDCHVANGGYAKNIAGVGEQKDFITVRVENRDFKTTPAYLAFAQQFFQLMQFGRECELLDSVKIYGDSMASAMSREDIRG